MVNLLTRTPDVTQSCALAVKFQDTVVHSVENWEAEFANNSNPGHRMDDHHHPSLTIHSRDQLPEKVLAGEVSLDSATAEFKLSWQSAAKWVRAFAKAARPLA